MATEADVAVQDKDAFNALVEAISKSGVENTPFLFSKFDVEAHDNKKKIRVLLKVTVPSGERLRARDFVADYLERRIDDGETFAQYVELGTTPQLDIILRFSNPTKQTSPQVIRCLFKPAGGGSGGGSDKTTIQEVGQAAYLALRYEKGVDLACDTTDAASCVTIPELTSALGNVKQASKVTAQQIAELEPEWHHAFVLGANKVANEIKGSNWEFHRGGGLDHKKDGAIVKAYNRVKKESTSKDNVPPNEDKWNPADIWMVQSGTEGTLEQLLEVEGTIDCLNNFFNKAYAKDAIPSKSTKVVPRRSLIGISLKKLGTTARFVPMNPPNLQQVKKGETVGYNKTASKSELTSFSSMDVYLCYGQGRNNSFQARNFGGDSRGAWQLELQGQYAKHGKGKGAVMREVLDKADTANPFKSLPPDEVDFNDCKIDNLNKTIKFGNVSMTVVDRIYALLDHYNPRGFDKGTRNETNMKSKIREKGASWRFSKINGLNFLYWLDSLPTDHANRAMKEMYLYASSQSEKSSVYYKLW